MLESQSTVTFQYNDNLDWAVYDSLDVRVSPWFASYDEVTAWWATGPDLVPFSDEKLDLSVLETAPTDVVPQVAEAA